MKNKDRWSSLSLSEKDALIKVYVSNGITSLDAIKKDYNSFDNGGNLYNKEPNITQNTDDNTPTILEDSVEKDNSSTYKNRVHEPRIDTSIKHTAKTLGDGIKLALGGYLSLLKQQSLQESRVNKFGTGGDTDGAGVENDIPTLDAYLQMKLQEARQKAIANSYNATEPILAKRYYSDEDVKKYEQNIKDAESSIEYYSNEADKYENMLKKPFTPSNVFVPNPEYMVNGSTTNARAERFFDYYEIAQEDARIAELNYNELKNNLEHVEKYGYDWTGYNCITNATGWYGDPYVCASNVEFAKNPEKFGYVEINVEDAQPGDIFQYNGRDGVPTHATLFSKKDEYGDYLVNYSNGGTGYDSLKKDSYNFGQGDRAYRFVGLPEDIEAWTQEYNEKYKNSKEGTNNHSNGGKINRFDTGGPTKTGQDNTSGIPIEFELGVMNSPFWTYNPEPTPIEPEIPYAHNYMSEDDVYKELDSIMSSTRDPKELPGKLDTFLRSQIVGNPNIKYYRDGLIADINHYIKYPYSSIIIHRNNQDRDRLHRATVDGHIPLVEQSRVVLTNAGKSTGIELSTNMLDTLAYKGGIAGAELNRLLGVPAQETGLGQFPGTTYIKPEDITALDEEHDFYGVSRSNFINNYGVNPTELMNNHYYYTNSADQATIGAIARKYGVGHDASGGWADAYIGYNEVTPEVEQAFKDAYWYSTRQRDKEDIFVDPIVQAYELDATGNYNSNMKDHNQLVEQRGIELWKSPEIQKWWEETGKAWYEKGLSERRLRAESENN